MNNNGIFQRYKEKTNEIHNLDRSLGYIVLTAVCSLLLSFLILCGPTTLLINMYMFYDLIPIVVLGVIVCAYFLLYLTRVFYLIGITKKECGSLKDVFLVDALIVLGIIVCLFMILI